MVNFAIDHKETLFAHKNCLSVQIVLLDDLGTL